MNAQQREANMARFRAHNARRIKHGLKPFNETEQLCRLNGYDAALIRLNKAARPLNLQNLLTR